MGVEAFRALSWIWFWDAAGRPGWAARRWANSTFPAIAVKGVRITGRNAQGVHMVRLEGGERVRAVAGMAERDEDEANGNGSNGDGSGDDSEE